MLNTLKVWKNWYIMIKFAMYMTLDLDVFFLKLLTALVHDRHICEIPHKNLLNDMSAWWFDKTKDIVPNHPLQCWTPCCQKCVPFKIEVVVVDPLLTPPAQVFGLTTRMVLETTAATCASEGLVDIKIGPSGLTPTKILKTNQFLQKCYLPEGYMTASDRDFVFKRLWNCLNMDNVLLMLLVLFLLILNTNLAPLKMDKLF